MKNNFYILLTGIGIGILMGLSESAILVQILVPILTVIASLVSILTGQNNPIKPGETSPILGLKNINVSPIMSLVIGLVLGVFLGLLSKNFDITNQGKLFGNVVASKPDLAVDSLILQTRLLSLKQEILILEKQNEYLLKQQIKPNPDGFSFADALSLKKNLEEQNKTISQLVKNADIKTNVQKGESESQTVLHGTVEDLCKLSYICNLNLTGADLVALCKNVDHYEIKRIIKSPLINTDSLKSKITQICNCK